MIKPVNHYQARPQIALADGIFAAQIIEPGLEGKLSSHKIWILPNKEYPIHEHPTEHILLVLEGGGYAKYWRDGNEYRFDINAGDSFPMPGNVWHQVGADSRGMIMKAISYDSKPLDDPGRLIVSEK